MSRRFLGLLSVVVLSSATSVLAGPSPGGTPAPAGASSGSAAAAGSGAGSAVQMEEDNSPPADMSGTDENPDAPKVGDQTQQVKVVVPGPKRPAGYPIEEVLRPITLPENMSEVSLDPHGWVSAPSAAAFSTALRVRYGITGRVQLGLTYLIGGIYDDPATRMKDYSFHEGKAVGLDVTVLLRNWVGVRVGIPFYVNPVALSLSIGVPMKFTFGDKFAIGGLDDLLNITLDRFAPSFYQEVDNAIGAYNDTNHTEQSSGHLRISAYGLYQYRKNVALIGRLGIDNNLGYSSASGGAGTGELSATEPFIRAQIDWSPRKFIDLGGSLGFDDLNYLGSFGPSIYLAVRI